MGVVELTNCIRDQAFELGFSSVGCSPVSSIPSDRFDSWLNREFHGEMAYLSRNRDKRLDPRRVLPSAKSVLSLTLDYFQEAERPYTNPRKGVFSRYALGIDYHLILEKRLKELLVRIREEEPAVEGRYYVDTGPVMEKHWAERAGLGWLGKHTNLISREGGSWFFIGEILLNLELIYDDPVPDYCGTCTRCIDACPTDAIVNAYELDSRRCISYLTIELKGEIPIEFRSGMGNLVFGCDICQDVCPWNRKSRISDCNEFAPRSIPLGLRELAHLGPEEFAEIFRRSPVKRSKLRGLLRNVAVAMGNSGLAEYVSDLEYLIGLDDPLITEHAKWALEQIGTLEAKNILETLVEPEESGSG